MRPVTISQLNRTTAWGVDSKPAYPCTKIWLLRPECAALGQVSTIIARKCGMSGPAYASTTPDEIFSVPVQFLVVQL